MCGVSYTCTCRWSHHSLEGKQLLVESSYAGKEGQEGLLDLYAILVLVLNAQTTQVIKVLVQEELTSLAWVESLFHLLASIGAMHEARKPAYQRSTILWLLID